MENEIGLSVLLWNRTRDALNYVDNCYENENPSGLCDELISRSISWDQEVTPCPFASGMCLADAIRLSTGLVNSHVDLGLNGALEDRMEFSRRVTCAPLNTAGRYEVVTNKSTHVTTYSLCLGPSLLSGDGSTFSTALYQAPGSGGLITHPSPGDYFLT